MNSIKKALKITALVCLIVLACLGVGISGGVPIPMSNSRRESEKDKIELLEDKEEDDEDVKR